MKVGWMFGGPTGPKYFLDAVPHEVAIGVTSINGEETGDAAIALQYPLPTLEAIAPVVKQMLEKRVEPTLHIWDLESKDPEIVLVLRLDDPSRELMLRVRSSVAEPKMLKAVAPDTCKQVVVASAATTTRASARKFLSRQKKTGFCTVMFSEAGQADGPLITPLLSLVTRLVTHQPFSLDLLR